MRIVGAPGRAECRSRRLLKYLRLSYAQAMLPILRVFPVGGVLLAIFILVLALAPPDGTRALLTPHRIAARGALIVRAEHPEWRQFLILAALRRAEELDRLRALPDSPPPPPKPQAAPAPEVASLPDEPTDSDPQDSADDPASALPLDIGETSTFELPISAAPEQPPVITPKSLKQPPASEIEEPVYPNPPPASETPPTAQPSHSQARASGIEQPAHAQEDKKPMHAVRSRHRLRHAKHKPHQWQSFNSGASNPPGPFNAGVH